MRGQFERLSLPAGSGSEYPHVLSNMIFALDPGVNLCTVGKGKAEVFPWVAAKLLFGVYSISRAYVSFVYIPWAMAVGTSTKSKKRGHKTFASNHGNSQPSSSRHVHHSFTTISATG